MATKTNGANGKAKKTANRPQFTVGIIPFDGRLTPERAKRWLAEEHAGFNLLVTNGLRHSVAEEDREAFVMLATGVEYMVAAC